MSVALQEVTDAQGKSAASYSWLTADTRDTAIVIPGTYEIRVSCVFVSQTLTPSGTFELRGGYTYTMDCNRIGGFQVDVVATQAPTATGDQ